MLRADSLASVLASPESEGRLRYVPSPGAAHTATATWELEETLGERLLRLREAGDATEHVIAITSTMLVSGGERQWFRCPGLGCGRRVGCLYMPRNATRWRCRHCHRLLYRSQRESCRSRTLIGVVASRMRVAVPAARWFLRAPRAPGWVA